MSQPPPPEAALAFGDRLPLAERYAEELAGTGVEWGLLGPAEPARIWDRHLLNCAAVVPLIPLRARVVDVGSGAGLPGLVLAIARPDLTVCALESNARRCRFLERVVAELELPGVRVCRARAEQVREPAPVVTARAVAPLPALLRLAWPLVAPGGQLIAIKGAAATRELASVSAGALRGARATVETCRIGERVFATVVRVERAA